MAPSDTQTQLETLLLELQMTEERISTGEVKPENAKRYLTRLEAIRDAYGPLVGQLAEEGTPVSKDERMGFLRRITADLDALENLIPQGLSTAAPHRSGVAPNLKLPVINLPVFSGNLEEWPRWYQAFFSGVDAREDLTSEDKLRFLFTTVTGEALQTISNLHPSGASYATALRRLKARYENKAAVLNYYLDKFLNPGRATEDAQSLRRLLDNVQGASDSLQARGYTRSELFDAISMRLILENLPECTRAHWHLRAKPDSTFSELCYFMEEEAHRALPKPRQSIASTSPPQTSGPVPSQQTSISVASAAAGPAPLLWRQRDTQGRNQKQSRIFEN